MTTPFWAIGVAWLLIYFPRFFVMIGQLKRPEGYDNASPREQQAKLEGMPKRANAAHMNAFEGFAPFAAAVLVAHLAGADPSWSAGLAIAYCALRFLYTLLYIANVAAVRTLVWMASFAVTGALFALAVL